MKATKCPICGETTLIKKRGEFRMDRPPNLPGGEIVIPKSTWLHCESCGEDILSSELEQAINRERRGVAPVS
jgi:YgiT-type zinc finger domain-containing protein